MTYAVNRIPIKNQKTRQILQMKLIIKKYSSMDYEINNSTQNKIEVILPLTWT